MRARIRQLNIIIVALLMIFSTTGVAIYHHICGCPVPTAQVADADGHTHSCCAAPEVPRKPTCCTDENHDACDREHHNKCKNEVTYLKAQIIFVMPVQKLAVSEASFEMPDSRMPDAGLFSDAVDVASPIINNYLIPPRAGGSLVILLHSIKIPSPEDLS